MSEAVFRISTSGGEELRNVLGQARNTYRSIAQLINADARRAARQREQIERDSIRAIDRIVSGQTRAEAQAERERTRAKLRELNERKRGEEKLQRDIERAQRTATRISDRLSKDRVRSAEKEAKEVERLARGMLVARERAEREATKVAQREYRMRERDMNRMYQYEARLNQRADADHRRSVAQRERRWGAMGSRVGSAVYGAATSYASSIHGQVQGARERRASTSRTINNAIYQAGAGAADAPELQAMVYQFAQQNGISSAEVAQGVNASQTEFNTIGNSRSTQQERRTNMRAALDTMLFARNTGQDTGEVLRVSGMLNNSGITDPAERRQTLLAMTGMAQRGAIELGSVTRTAMAPMQQRIAQSQAELRRTNPNATDADRSHATQQAVLQTFAEMEVGRAMGQSPRTMGNVMAAMGNSLQSDNTQQKMLQNIRSSNHGHGNAAAEAALFERGQDGRMRLRSTDALGLSRNLQTAFHGDSTAMQNVFAGGGHGNPQALQANWRRTLGLLMGGEGNENIGRMISGAGKDFTEDDVKRGEGLFAHDEQTTLTSLEEKQNAALTDTTNALVRFSNALNEFEKLHPFSAPAAEAGGNAAGNIAAGVGGGLIGRVLSKAVPAVGTVGRAIAAAPAAVAALPAAISGGASLATIGAGTVAAGATAAGVIGLGAGEAFTRLTNNRADASFGGRGHHSYAAGNHDSIMNPATWRMFAGFISDAIRRNPITATVSPADVVHARTVAATANQGGR
jgi:hypothetical protein